MLAAAPTMKPSKLRDNLIEHADNARLSRELVRLGHSVTICVAEREDGVHEPTRQRIEAIGCRYVGLRMRGLASLRRLREAGCTVNFYQRIAWYRLHRINNRTHRELLVIDGKVGFTGGAGVADWWYRPVKGRPTWRDTMIRLEGPAVAALQGVFAENWLECCGEILTSPRHWPALAKALGALFVRSYERGERVHLAMLARGYTGRLPS